MRLKRELQGYSHRRHRKGKKIRDLCSKEYKRRKVKLKKSSLANEEI